MPKRDSFAAMDEPIFLGEEQEDDTALDVEEDQDAKSDDASTAPPSSPLFRRGSLQSSFSQTPAWPQSYRQSIDLYSNFGSPNISTFSTSAGRMSSSYLSTSYRRHAKSTERLSPLTTPLAQPKGEEEEEEAYHEPSSVPPKYASFTFTEAHVIPQKCGATQATLNGINVLCGVGILTTPYALKEGGWLSLVLFFILGAISLYTGILLRWCLDSEPGLQTYPDIGQVAFGVTGRVIMSVFLYLELYGACVEYIILEGDNISSMFPNASLSLHGVTLTGTELFMIMTAICVLPTVWLKDLRLLSYVSAVGVVASFVVVFCVAWVGVFDGIGFHERGALLKLSSLPVSLGLYGFCYSGHSVFPNIYSSLKKPSQFPTILTISFALCTILYGGMAVMGFTMFGESTQSQITLNLPDKVASKIAVWSAIVNPFTKYALSITPVALSLEELLPSSGYNWRSYCFSLAVRTTLVASTLCVALLLPFFGYVSALMGSFLSMMLCLIFPAACFLKLGKKVTILQRAICTAIIMVGTLCCITGTYSSVAEMIKSLQ